MTASTGEAARDLKVMYLRDSLIFAWKYSISKEEKSQGKDDWFLQQVIRELFYKAKMQRTVSFGGVNAHLIYTFDAKNMREHYPLESDYVATCSVDSKTYLKIDRLELQGVFEQEYD